MDAQEEFFRVFGNFSLAQAALCRAKHELQEFYAAHPGESFRVFRPESIAAALTNDIKPLFGSET